MSTRLPLARRIRDGEKPLIQDLGRTLTPHAVSKMLERSVFFDIQVAKDLIVEQIRKAGKSIELPRESFGPLRPPYPHMWMEWSTPTLAGGSVNCACTLSEQGNQYDLLLFVSSDTGGHICCVPRQFHLVFDVGTSADDVHLDLDRDGPGHDVGAAGDDFVYCDVDGLDEIDMQFIAEYEAEPLTVKMALSLLNCRNVEIAEGGRINFRRSGVQKRRGEKPFTIRYNTILLPGGGSKYDAASGTHRATALHRVRGHFKTFTAEKPLMGRHVGTYWWGWQLRGTAQNGVVISDYQLDTDM
jgi:hypothetical protein